MSENQQKIKFNPEKKKKLISDIQSFFLDNREEEIGDLQAELLLDFLTEKVGAEIYNQALNDAMLWFKTRMSDIEIDYYSLEKRSDNNSEGNLA